LEITCDRYEDLFAAFVSGLASLLISGNAKPREARDVALKEPAPADLLVALGRRVLALFETERFVPARLQVRSAGPAHLFGRLLGEPYDPARMDYHLEVKGVTYHDLEVVNQGSAWRGRVTFDV